MPLLKQLGTKLLNYQGGIPKLCFVLSLGGDVQFFPKLPHLPVADREFLLCLAVKDCSGTLGTSWSGASLHCVCCVCRQVSVHIQKKEQFSFSLVFNAQTGSLWSLFCNMLMHTFIAIDCSKTVCVLTILVDLGQEQTSWLLKISLKKINSEINKFNTMQLRNNPKLKILPVL